MIGQTLAHYRILEKLGEGGMGVVYKARDTHLDRFVAIKVLPPGKVLDPERKRRFVQEAKAASALNHPNIITIHDIASESGRDFIVMECVEGKTLDQLIGRKGLKLGEALGYAAQIADGLAKAHAAGIVHRDLKPSNVMVSEDGLVKILDFGLAKLTESIPEDENAPTQTAGLIAESRTQAGTIIGTLAYMSPEQAEGKKVDARSDIFSFGSVLYEMLAGQRAFNRESRLSTLTAITTEDPKALRDVIGTIPAEVEQVVNRCLRKDPQRRWQNMSDLKVVLQDLKEESESGKLRAPQRAGPEQGRSWGVLIAGAVVVAAVGAVLIWQLFYRQGPARGIEISRLTYDSGATGWPAISPDGKFAAYASDRGGKGDYDIWIQQIPTGEPKPRTDHPADDAEPSFSPDGLKIVFRSERDGGGLYIVDTLGGEARRIVDRGHSPRFSPDGSYISYVDVPAALNPALNRMYLVAPQGGVPEPFHPEFALLEADLPGSGPIWSPDGKFILFYGQKGSETDTGDWYVAPLKGGPPFRTGAKTNLALPAVWSYPSAWAGDFVYYATGTTVEGVNLFRTAIQPASWQIPGKPERLTSGAGMQIQPSVAQDGRMLYANEGVSMNIWSLAAKPDQGSVSGQPQQVTLDQTAKFNPSITRDGSKLAFTSFGGLRTTRREVRIRDLASGRETVFPGQSALIERMPVLSADGSVLAFRDKTAKNVGGYVVAGGSTSGREICTGCRIHEFFSDANYALVEYLPGLLVRQNLTTGEQTNVLDRGTGLLHSVSLSPDDRWITFAIGKPDGKAAIYVAPLREKAIPSGEWMLICEDVRYLGSPKWSPDGKLLYYLSERDGRCCIWAQRLDSSTKKMVGAAFAVFHQHNARSHMNYPPGNGTLGVASDKLVFYMADWSGNLWWAQLGSR
jgi:eukaryotic-like serine/threonine-protein kinase